MFFPHLPSQSTRTLSRREKEAGRILQLEKFLNSFSLRERVRVLCEGG